MKSLLKISLFLILSSDLIASPSAIKPSKAILESNVGEMEVEMKLLDNGLWKENDIFYMLRRARAIYKRDEDPEYTEKTIKQEFSIQASGNIIDNIFVNDDFKMKMPY